MQRKILTFEDLVMFCEKNNFTRFSSKESGYQICVQVPAQFNKEESDDSTMLFANVLAFHTGINRNKSNLTEAAAKKAIKNLAYKPVLANFCEIDGVKDFTSHDFTIDKNGDYVYYEKQIGCFTADSAYLEQDPDNKDRMNVFAKVAIPREYTDAAEIIERKNGTRVSVELAVNEMSYSAKEKVLMLEDVDVMGLTCLGIDPETGEQVMEGMENAHIQIEDFSVENNSLTFNAEMINSIADAVIERLSNINNQRKEEAVDMDFEEKIEKVTDETEVMEEATEEEVQKSEEASEEAVEDVTEETPEVVKEFDDDNNDDESTDDESDDSSDDGSDDSSDDGSDEEPEEEVVIDDDTLPPTHKKVVNDLEFELSLSDIQNAMCDLVNSTYAESDNDYYGCEIYQDSKTVVMIGVWSGKAYKQNYKVRNGVYTLVGDRISVKPIFVTADEEAELDKMRTNYSSISEKLSKYESEPEKMEILNSEEYANIADTAEFSELKKAENHFNMSVEDLRAECDRQLLAYAKGTKIEFSGKEKQKVGMKQFGRKDNKKSGRYGNLFKK